jgi:hypothetical protein
MDESSSSTDWLTPTQTREALGLAKTKSVAKARKRGRLAFKWDASRGCYVYSRESVERYDKGRTLRPFTGNPLNGLSVEPDSVTPPAACVSSPVGRKDRPCHLYIVEAVGVDRFKVGSSIDVGRRIRQLAVASPFPLELRHTVPGRKGDEFDAHAELADMTAHCEWFHGPLERIVEAVEKAVSRNAAPTPPGQ